MSNNPNTNQMDEVNDFLAQAEAIANSNRFIIGVMDRGITLYKQQVRALNLLYALHANESSPRIKPNSKIAIIGGGVAGITAAAGAVVLGHEVYLLERQTELCHLQQGCDIRWIHPHIYDWPEYGTESVYAGLPLLNWRAGTASQVVEQLIKGFETYRALFGEKLNVILGASVEVINEPNEPMRVKWEGAIGNKPNHQTDVDVVIFAVGFGVEHGVTTSRPYSYWRNDHIGQPIISFEEGRDSGRRRTPVKLLISGTGDGGLIDLFRARIARFNQGSIIEELIDLEHDKDGLIPKLREIVNFWGRNDPKPKSTTWLFDEYVKLSKEGVLRSFQSRLEPRLRKDTDVYLNGTPANFARVLNLDKASTFNTLLAYQLYELDGFRYLPGKCTVKSSITAQISGEKNRKYTRVIMRHGTNREETLRAAGYTNEELEILLSNSKYRAKGDTSKPLWHQYKPGWWEDKLNKARVSKNGLRRPDTNFVEFVPPATAAIANTFVTTLAHVIQNHKHSITNIDFRLTLHRLISIGNQDYFQQITRYAGTRLGGVPGRVFSVSGGLGGLSCRLGEALIVRDRSEFETLWSKLSLENLDAHPMHRDVQSLFACPFFVRSKTEKSSDRVNLLLFMDSTISQFFTDDLLNIIYAACTGFIENVQKMKANGDIHFISSSYQGYLPPRSKSDTKILAEMPTLSAAPEFRKIARSLTFTTLDSIAAQLTG